MGKNLARPTDEKEILDRTTLREIGSHLDVKMKALFLFLESSGARIGETLQLSDSDLYLDAYPARVRIRPETTKTKTEWWVFISTKAKEALVEWFKVRRDYLAIQKVRPYKTVRTEELHLVPRTERARSIAPNSIL